MIDLSNTQTKAGDYRPLGVIRVQGADSASFLQGQLSADIVKLAIGATTLAGYHNVQGRAIALLRVSRIAIDELLLTLPLELVAAVVSRLGRYVLRAKTKLSDVSDEIAVLGIDGAAANESDALLAARTVFDWGTARRVALRPKQPTRELAAPSATHLARWHAADIADGLAQVYVETSEAFVAQMLNLDVLGGIAFDKGCYTGQEVIARTHYRGRVKRRLQRFASSQTKVPLVCGVSGSLTDGRTFRVVDSVALSDGRWEWLGVTSLASEAPGVPGAPGPASTTVHDDSVAARQLPLPYPLPD